VHAKRLIKEIVENDEQLRRRFVVGYLIGFPIALDYFDAKKI